MIITVIDINGTPHRYDPLKMECPLDTRKTVAKKTGTLRVIHRVMVSADGELFNPPYDGRGIDEKDRQRGGYVYNLVRCSAKCYEQYVTFLRSKNRTHFILAQRRYLDGS